jgi:peroxiredoxin
VLAVSTDPDTMLTNWAREASFPFVFGSDTGQVIGKAYGSVRGRTDLRNVFVISPEGRITDRIMPFNVLSADAYEELRKMVERATKGPGGGGGGNGS